MLLVIVCFIRIEFFVYQNVSLSFILYFCDYVYIYIYIYIYII